MKVAHAQEGFTLIELLAVMAIIAVLTALAIPQYQAYKKRALDLRAVNDLRNIATAEEAYYLDWEEYKSCADAACVGLPGITALSQGVRLQITAAETSFTGSATHPRGSGRVFMWDNARGGLQ